MMAPSPTPQTAAQTIANPVANASAKHLVIYDTDPGVDDAMALYYALAHPGIELLGITTTFGNVTAAQATANALYLTQLAGRKIPVAQGAQRPLLKHAEAPPDFIHGVDGLGNLPARAAATGQADPRSAAQFIVDMARQHPGQITLVPVGPLTNMALALQLEPQLPQLLKQVVLMGGSIAEHGNVSPVAEANIWNDPHAADAVLAAGFKLTMVGLDVTYQVLLPASMFEKIAAHHRHAATDTLLHAVKFYSAFYQSRFAHMKDFNGCYGHDVLAFICLTNPELFGYESGPTRVVTEGISQGHTIMKRQGFMQYPQSGWQASVPAITACMQVDVPAVTKLFETTLLSAWL
jgi:inosine-uridine nucleoside N-ribohydrolase